MSQTVHRRTRQPWNIRWPRRARAHAGPPHPRPILAGDLQLDTAVQPATSLTRPGPPVSSAPATVTDAEALRVEVRQSALLLTLTFAVLALVTAIGWLLAQLS